MTKKSKKLISVLLTLALIFSTFSTALAEDSTDKSGTIDGNSTVTNPVFSFYVPTTADFAFNPFEVGDTGSQITSADIFVINKSSIPIQVSFDYSLTAKSGVVVKDTAADVVTTGADKEMYIAAVPAKVAAVNTTGSALTTTGSAITWSSEDAVIGEAGSGTDANLTYVLDEATFTDANSNGIAEASEFTSVDPNKSAAVFRFKGTINPDADWKAADATMSVVYAIKGVTTTAYGTFNELEDTQNVKSITDYAAPEPTIAPEPTTPPEPTTAPVPDVAPDVSTKSASVTSGSTSAAYPISLGSGTLAATGISKVTYEYSTTQLYDLTAVEFTVSSDGKTLTLNKAATYMNNLLVTKGTHKLRVQFNDTPKTTVNITLTVN